MRACCGGNTCIRSLGWEERAYLVRILKHAGWPPDLINWSAPEGWGVIGEC